MHHLKSAKLATQLFINGQFLKSRAATTFDVFSPVDQTKIATVQQAGPEDIDLAVKSAKQAFYHGPWATITPDAKSGCLYRLADLIDKHSDELAALESWNTGKPFGVSRHLEVPHAASNFRYYAGWVDKIKGSVFPINGPYLGYTLREPVGVVGQIIPWNVPLIMQAWKLAPALAAGCTVVLKSAEQTPLTALRVAELINQAGFPKGVVNIISGDGDAGRYLSQHRDIDKVAFTGSIEVGYRIMRGSHKQNLKRVTLELGGKSANIITANADVDKAVAQACDIYYNTGQVCFAGTRIFVHSSKYEEFIRKVVERSRGIVCGDPFNPETNMGPLISKQQYDRVMGFIESGKDEGAKLVLGGKRVGTKGYFVEPTIFVDVQDHMKIAREEIFGPVMSIFKFETNEEVMARANNTFYGLAAGVMTENNDEAIWFSKRIRAGTVYVNCYTVVGATAPFGGFKDSGIGREQGEQGLNNYLETKTVITKWSG